MHNGTFTQRHAFVNPVPPFICARCGHCKKLAKPFAAAAQLVNGRGRLAKVDCDAHAKLCERFEATSYPTLKFFANGKPVDYEYGRSAQDMAYWVVESSSLSAAAAPAGTIDAVAKNLSKNLAADETSDSAIAAFVAQARVR
jgi:thioredoxin-like negative regulator of GroEL